MRIARIRALTVLCALALVAGLITVWAIRNDSQLSASSDCEPGAVEIKTAPIPDPSEIEVVVLNGTDRTGLGEQAAAQLEDRGFIVTDVGDTDEKVDEPAVVFFGPAQFAAGVHVHAYFLGGRQEFSLDWDKPITIILGDEFAEVRSTSDARQSFAQSGSIEAPEGTCTVE
ncbi:LytR C-terminal domain-containing protein [Glycomyces harbinensis]|uniref:LytR cell envelope-related transcriptional attenuator n=1 Tax=Glycomyces harbinensis TaxID=58114 RepID=A0A1G6U1U1_9ACTN|nr:LytR C-terminal domain-containing protein [Glycomyces harbinensis]SDD35164.1 LytR cell envelope-related transcriptional attenuator [Glycomyces harbinensis]